MSIPGQSSEDVEGKSAWSACGRSWALISGLLLLVPAVDLHLLFLAGKKLASIRD